MKGHGIAARAPFEAAWYRFRGVGAEPPLTVNWVGDISRFFAETDLGSVG